MIKENNLEKKTVTLNAEIPPYLNRKMKDILATGDFIDVDDFVTVALTYFISSYRIGNPTEKDI
jgi:hypothetical protein